MASFAIILYGHCRRHVVGQWVVSDISVVRSCWSISCLCSESNDTILLLRLLTDVLGTSILLHIANITCPTTWRSVLGDHARTENLVTSLHLIYSWRLCLIIREKDKMASYYRGQYAAPSLNSTRVTMRTDRVRMQTDWLSYSPIITTFDDGRPWRE